MTTIDLYEPTTAAAHRSPALLAGLRRLWAGYRERRRHRKVALQLLELDDHLLRDIGIDPRDVHDALRGRPGPTILFHPMRRPFEDR